MQIKKRLLVGGVCGALLIGTMVPALAATVHYNDGSTVGGSAEWTAWTEEWNTVATDYTQVSLTPGEDETELNFAWYSLDNGSAATPVVHFGTDRNSLQSYTGTAGDVDTSLTDGVAYHYNHVTVTGLEPNTTYYYTVEKNGVQTEVETYETQSFDTVKMLYVGDPQIGASKGQPQGGETLAAESGVANTAARNDAFGWNRTLEAALAQDPDVSFIISAGDQVNKTGQAKEEEYAGYLSPDVLAGLPVATTIGNHDSLNADYMYHFNNPNATEYGATQAGGDYYYSYGNGLFIVLNTNNYNVAEHEQAIQDAIASDPNAAWRIVTIHQDIYGSGLDHSDTDGMILRTQLTPIFDEYDIDVVLQGHDHTYSRSKLLYGDGQTHGAYEFQLNADGSDYDWDHAYDINASTQIPLYPEDGDTAGQALLNDFQADNHCYTIETTVGNTVVDPNGTLYMTANSASGSKYYELISAQQDYIAERSQNWLPSWSVITLSEDSFSIDTYQLTADGQTEKIDETFTIRKTGDSESLTAPLTRAQAVQRLYDDAGRPAVSTAAGFSDVAAGADYLNAVAWAKAQGIVNGVSDSSFAPDETITQAQFAAMLTRYAAVQGKAGASRNATLSQGMTYAESHGLLTGSAVTASSADYALTKLG
ncbi:fibronectin type III domain-containing protein [Oscillibacter valericigenes]|uniref:fibronectin type III domain-containing protein n=1 Tax=Oscillibacter valericigenes TaxID=351091 RepID=UPI00195DD12F|nr:metallophosphoesterase [Oscillibacter valericigenes]